MPAMGSQAPIARSLLAWYARKGRDLPWRRDPNAYRVWVSEIMLQQTTVVTAIPYYNRFLRRYPTVRSLARAGEEDLLAAWSGLGYYHRARNLLKSARIICREHGGEIPDTLEDLLALPGIGAYTAGAILSIGHNLPFAAIDGNIQRVISRLGSLRGDPTKAPVRRAIAGLIHQLMPRRRASDFNQALMDLGAMVCTPREPRCPVCPVRSGCEARRLGLVDSIPPRPKAGGALAVEMVAVAVRRDGDCLLVTRRDGSINRGLLEFPLAGFSGEGDARELAIRMGARLVGRVGHVRHTITRHRIRIAVYDARPSPAGRRRGGGRRPISLSEPQERLSTGAGDPSARWCALEEIAADQGLPVSGTARKIARLLMRPGRRLGQTAGPV